MHEAFNETTDLYLQLLRKAQEVEDLRLVGMILERLKSRSSSLLPAEAACAVIPFPGAWAKPDVRADESPFWPRMAAIQVGVIVAVYALMVVGHAFFV